MGIEFFLIGGGVALLVFVFFGKSSRKQEDLDAIEADWFDDTQHAPNAVSDRDSWEGVFWRDYETKHLKVRARLNYTDMNQNTTERDFDIEHYFFADEENNFFIQGYCHLRKANRTFRVNRINSLVDLENGEIFEGDAVKIFLDKAYVGSPHYEWSEMLKKYSNEKDVLIYLSKLDGRFTKKEKELLFDFMYKSDLPKSDRRELYFFFEDYLKNELPEPSQRTANNAVKNVNNKGEEASRALVSVIRELAALSKKMNPVAKAGADMMLKKLGSDPLE